MIDHKQNPIHYGEHNFIPSYMPIYEDIDRNSIPPKEKLKIIPNVPVAYFAITAEELENFNLQEGDTEGIVNYALGIEGVLMGISLFEKEGKIRMSFRSVSNVPAVDFAKEFGGGGHFNAAGAKSDKSLSDTEQKLIQIITEKAHLLRNE